VGALRPRPGRVPEGRELSALQGRAPELLTVSSSIKTPISVRGRILDVFMELFAITVIATLAGAIGSFLQKRGQETDDRG
jgi:hypothetical protein